MTTLSFRHLSSHPIHVMCFLHHYLFLCLIREQPEKKEANEQTKRRVNFSFNLYKNVLIMARDWT
jgi:hypothetical protein